MPEVQSGELEAELDAMVRTLLDEQQSERADVVRLSKQAVRDEYEKLMRPLRLSTRDLQDEAMAIRGRIQHAQREQAEALAAEERERAVNADITDIRRFLSPFINSGHLQPKVGANKWTTERTIDSKPVSLSRLKASGALDKTLEGLERLFIFGGGKNPGLHNRRPLGDFPEYSSEKLRKPDIQASVERAQDLLIKHGDALVEMKLLSP